MSLFLPCHPNDFRPSQPDVNNAMAAMMRCMENATRSSFVLVPEIGGDEIVERLRFEGFTDAAISWAAHALLFDLKYIYTPRARFPHPDCGPEITHPIYHDALEDWASLRKEHGIEDDSKSTLFASVDWNNPRHARGVRIEWLLFAVTGIGKKLWATMGENAINAGPVAKESIPDAAVNESQRWYHENEDAPTEFSFGPVPPVGKGEISRRVQKSGATKETLAKAVNITAPTLEKHCLNGKYWAKKLPDGSFQLFFQSKNEYALANTEYLRETQS